MSLHVSENTCNGSNSILKLKNKFLWWQVQGSKFSMHYKKLLLTLLYPPPFLNPKPIFAYLFFYPGLLPFFILPFVYFALIFSLFLSFIYLFIYFLVMWTCVNVNCYNEVLKKFVFYSNSICIRIYEWLFNCRLKLYKLFCFQCLLRRHSGRMMSFLNLNKFVCQQHLKFPLSIWKCFCSGVDFEFPFLSMFSNYVNR